MKNENFCAPQNISVLIPYKDLEKLIEFANKYEQLERLAKRMDERCARMQLLYSEILEKVAEMDRYL